MRPSPLPEELAAEFSTSSALALGVPPTRLRASDLEAPFRGVRMRTGSTVIGSPYRQAEARELAIMRALSNRLSCEQFFSHRSAALLWGVPLPYRPSREVHIGVVAPKRAPRIRGVTAHTFLPGRVECARVKCLPVAAPAFTFATLGSLSIAELVAAGDHLVRVHRAGYGRREVGKPPLATITQLNEIVALGRWPGMPRLRRALELIREDSWSPRESMTRVALVQAGLPEPELNIDLFDGDGGFLGCVDMAYLRYKIAVEYQGEQHALTYAQDIERIERLRAAGWIVIQVTKTLAASPAILITRVEAALRSRGWQG